MLSYFIFQDKQLKATFANQESDFAAFEYLIKNQHQSTDYALKYGGWKVEIYDPATQTTIDYKTDKVIKNPLSEKYTKTYFATFDYFEIALPYDVAKSCHHSGPCDADIDNCLLLPEIVAELAKIDPVKLAKVLQDYGAWDKEQLKNHAENLQRILWLAAGDIQESEEYSKYFTTA